MVVHLFSGQSNYAQAWLALFARHFSAGGNWFIMGFGSSPGTEFQYDEEIKKRMLLARNPLHLIFRIIPALFMAKRIYFHSLAYDPSLLFWQFNKKILSRSTWIIWGFDLYAFQKTETIRNRFYERLRRSVIPSFPEIAAFVEEDAVLARKVYNSSAKYIPILYPIPVETKLLDIPCRRESSINILIGNSADPGNRHFEIIDMLARFSKENISVWCPLSYGGTQAYRNEVAEKGERVFGTKFHAMLQMMSPSKYAEILCTIDIAVMNHRRQQGLGNILSLLYLGKKVFLRSDTSSYQFFIRNKCLIYNTSDIDKMTYQQFTGPLPDDHSNRDYSAFIMSEENYYKLWSNLLNRE
jgi:dTDP-N-acetylfucosamine:lipid II N-acetylfucosaminyltransferase